LLVIDSLNRRTGFDALTGRKPSQIPKSFYSVDGIVDDETGDLPPGTSHSVHIYRFAEGSYGVNTEGLKLGLFTLRVRAFSQDGSPQPPVSVQGIAGVGSTSTFDAQFNPSSASVPQVVRVATFDSTLADINNSLQLGLIDDEGIANSLSQKFQAAADAAARGQAEASKNILRAFKNEVTAQRSKHISDLAAQVLLEDADSLLSQSP
jgi:hypothetical protein